MNSGVLVAALVAPVVGALAALLVPSGKERGPRKPGRRARKKAPAEGTASDAAEQTADDATLAVEIDGPEPVALDPDAAERAARTRRIFVRVAALATAALWIAVSLLGPSTAGPARAVGPIAPAAAGAALLLAAVSRPARRLPAVAGALALAAVAAGLALGAGDDNADLVVVGLAAAAGLVALADRTGDDGSLVPEALALAGTAALAGGLIRMMAGDDLSLASDATLALDAGVLLVGGSAAVAIAAALRPRSAAGLLLPVALVLGVPSAAVVGPAGDGMALILMLLAVGGAAAWALSPRSPRRDLRPLVAILALTSLAAAALPTSGVPGSGAAVSGMQAAGVPAAWLLAAATVITAVTLVPLAALSALPGASALVVVLVADPEPTRIAVVGLIVATVVAGAAALRRPAPVAEGADDIGPLPVLLSPLVAAVPALAVGLWLVAAPESWSWVGDTGLEGWTATVAVAVAGGLIAVVAGGAMGRVAVPVGARLAGPDPVPAPADTATGGRLALAAGVALGLALIALLASGSGAG